MFSIHWDKALSGGMAAKLEAQKEKGKDAVKKMLNKRAEGKIGFLDSPYNTASLSRIKEMATWVTKNADDLIVLGIGGSSLGGKTIMTSLTNKFSNSRPRVTFVDNVDAEYFMEVIGSLDLSRTVFNVISKSGSTAETMSQFLVVYDMLSKKLGKAEAVSRIILTTDPEKGALRPLANTMGFKTLDVPQNVGGRFSVLTDVGMLPAQVAGVDVDAMFDGARQVSEIARIDDIEKNFVLKYALLKYLHALDGRKTSVLMPYSTKLFDLSAWYVQLWAESLGKHGLGQTPIPSTGATDQHSQLQLFMEGPKDKFMTFIGIEEPGKNVTMPKFDVDVEAFSYLSGHTMHELLRAEMLSTERALFENNVPSVRIELNKLNASSIGMLFMFFEAAVAITGELMGIDAFDQPGVELSKNYTYTMMGRRGY